MKADSEDRKYMEMAIELAKGGVGWVNPNPLVGAVIVKDGRIIGKGFHRKYGELHAEREALKNCTEDPRGACDVCHSGAVLSLWKNAALHRSNLEQRNQKVVIGSDDPNPKVSGKGIRQLREHGTEVVAGVCKEQCDELNKVFFHYIRTGKPYVVMKYAMTMDGKIAAYTGASKWITGETARNRVQQDRHRYMAIMAGIGTVLQDDPLLTCRLPDSKSPIRVICDTKLRIPLTAQIVNTIDQAETWIATCSQNQEKIDALEQKGCRILSFTERISLQELMKRLGENGIDSVLLEGGASMNWSALSEGIVSKVQCYIAPKLFGGTESKGPVGGKGVAVPAEAFRLQNMTYTLIGEDILLEGELESCLQGL